MSMHQVSLNMGVLSAFDQIVQCTSMESKCVQEEMTRNFIVQSRDANARAKLRKIYLFTSCIIYMVRPMQFVVSKMMEST